jgi:peptidoglycan/xylan/chitin deacetylase (PgdA/CDA1 family)
VKPYFIKTPRILERLFSSYTWRFDTDRKEIFLTFDDGPTPEITPFVLKQLKQYNAKATFFCIGKNIENHPEIFHQILSEKHSVGNHTQNHLNGWKTKNINYLESVLKCEDVIFNLADKTKESKLFRPPYGRIKKSQAKEILKRGYRIIMWNVLSADFDKSISKEKCLENVLKNTKKGGVIVFHDSLKASEKLQFVLPKVLEEFSKKGFSFKGIN